MANLKVGQDPLPACLAVLSVLNWRMHQIDGNRDNAVEVIIVAATLKSTGEAGMSWGLLRYWLECSRRRELTSDHPKWAILIWFKDPNIMFSS